MRFGERIMADLSPDFAKKLEELRARFVERFADRLEHMERHFANLVCSKGADDTLTALKAFRAEAHKLTGTAGTFGFHEVGSAAAEIESYCDALIADGKLPSAADRRTLEGHLDVLRRGCA